MGFLVSPSDTIQIDFDWNGSSQTVSYTNEQQMNDMNTEIMQSPADVIRWLLFYMIALGHNAESMPSQIGKKLVVDIHPSVQQTIALV
jgi:hypothetical protein